MERRSELMVAFIRCPACGQLDKETPVAAVRETMITEPEGEMSCITCGAAIPLKEQRQYIDDVYNACEARDKEDDRAY